MNIINSGGILLLISFIYFCIFKPIQELINKEKFEEARFNYTIRFYQINEPIDIKENLRIMKQVDIILPNNGLTSFYTVSSKLNDTKLQTLLMTEYHLNKGQVLVTRA